MWNGATALGIPVGAASEDLRYLKSIALQMWLFGYELPGEEDFSVDVAPPTPTLQTPPPPSLRSLSHAPFPILSTRHHTPTDTIMLFTDKEMHVLSSAKKS